MAKQTKRPKRSLNEGQKALLSNYAGPAMAAFWDDDREAPDPEEFFQRVYDAHPEIEAALSGTIHQIFHGALIIYSSAVIETATEVEKKGTFQLLSAVLTGEKTADDLGGSVWAEFDVPENVQPYVRGLAPEFFFQIDDDKMPFWWRENNRIHQLYFDGFISTEQLKKGTLYTLQNTIGYEKDVDAPPGYEPWQFVLSHD